MRFTGHAKKIKGIHTDFGGATRRKETIKKNYHWWKDNTAMVNREMGRISKTWIHLVLDSDN
jgi:hypothetical protein